jgi:hypothetical protein
MKIHKLSVLKEDYLNKALAELSAGFKCLCDLGSEDMNSFMSSDSPTTFSFSDAKTRFERVGAYTSLLIQSNFRDIEVNGRVFRQHMDWILANSDVTKKWCDAVYSNSDSTETELEQVYQLHDSYCTAIGNLKACFKKIEEGEFIVHWIGCSSPPVIPNIPDPPIVNRKYK